MSETSERARAAHRQVAFIVGVLISSFFVYALVVELISRTATVDETVASPAQAVRFVFYAIAVSVVFSSHIVKALVMRRFNPKSEDELLDRLRLAHVVTAALGETPAILGFVLFFLNRAYYADFYILSLISLYLMVRHYPRFGQWERVLRQYADSDPPGAS